MQISDCGILSTRHSSRIDTHITLALSVYVSVHVQADSTLLAVDLAGWLRGEKEHLTMQLCMYMGIQCRVHRVHVRMYKCYCIHQLMTLLTVL